MVVTKERKDIDSIIYMNSISELNYIKNNNKYIEVGASTPLSEFENYNEKYYSDFTSVLKRYGSVQIRNTATIAGNIATASPIGDTLPLLMALDAKVIVDGNNGKKTIRHKITFSRRSAKKIKKPSSCFTAKVSNRKRN